MQRGPTTLTNREIVERIARMIKQADEREIEGSDEATARDLETFDNIVELLSVEHRLSDLARLR